MAETGPKCRHCGEPLTRTLVDLGLSPLANSYVSIEKAVDPEPRYPLHARVCDRCFLVQVDDAVPADHIFSSDYAYFSSFSESWLRHSRAYADMATQRFGLDQGTLVIEIASNDGYLLQYFVARGVPVLGIEPSANTAAVAESKGVPTRVDFFSQKLARDLAAEGIRPRLICSANVLAHVPDINDFAAGIATLLDGDAVYTVEFPHLLNLISEVQFDTIYHEHYSYLSLLSVERIMAGAGLRVFDVDTLPTHGGSLRVYICLADATFTEAPRVAAMREREHEGGLDSPEGYDGFAAKVEAVREDLLRFLQEAKADGLTVAAYGAAAKGNTLLNFCGIGPDLVSFAVDRNPAKQNTLLPGSHIPVRPVEALRENRPDYILILPWNIKDEVMEQLDDLAQAGSRFVIAIPKVTVD